MFSLWQTVLSIPLGYLHYTRSGCLLHVSDLLRIMICNGFIPSCVSSPSPASRGYLWRISIAFMSPSLLLTSSSIPPSLKRPWTFCERISFVFSYLSLIDQTFTELASLLIRKSFIIQYNRRALSGQCLKTRWKDRIQADISFSQSGSHASRTIPVPPCHSSLLRSSRHSSRQRS